MPDKKELAKQMDELLSLLRTIKPVASPCSAELRAWWETKGLPVLRDQVLSELRRNNHMPPRLLAFMDDGTMAVVNVAEAAGDHWGTARSKDATAFIHRLSALVPGTHAVVFCVEAWSLKSTDRYEIDRQRDKYPDMGDHPDREEVVMFQMLHYERERNAMMQLSTMIMVDKVLGATRLTWQHTKLGEATITDPLGGEDGVTMKGRFIFGDPENPS